MSLAPPGVSRPIIVGRYLRESLAVPLDLGPDPFSKASSKIFPSNAMAADVQRQGDPQGIVS